MNKRNYRLSWLVLLLPLLLSACSFPWKKSGPAAVVTGDSESVSFSYSNQLKKFNDQNEFVDFLGVNQGAEAIPASASQAKISWVENSDSHRDDILKVAGSYAYALDKNNLLISKINPFSESSVISTLTFKSRPSGLILSDNFLAVYGLNEDLAKQDDSNILSRQNPFTFLKIFDISEPNNPKQLRDLNIEGQPLSLRVYGQYLYLQTSYGRNIEQLSSPWPQAIDSGRLLENDCSSQTACVSPEAYYFDIDYSAYYLENLLAVNIKDNSEALAEKIFILDEGHRLDFSGDSFYVSYSPIIKEATVLAAARREVLSNDMPEDLAAKLEELSGAPSYLLSPREKVRKSERIFDEYFNSLDDDKKLNYQTAIDDSYQTLLTSRRKAADSTDIFKFQIEGEDIVYQANAKIRGRLLDYLSFNELDGKLRLATRRDPLSLGSEEGHYFSSLFVLDDSLETIGSLENLETKGEVAGARFALSRAYLLPVNESEPLYAIDIKDGRELKVLNPVSLSGAVFLAPLSADGEKLISLGYYQGGAGDASNGGLKLSLLDFSNTSEPAEIDSYLLGDEKSRSLITSDKTSFFFDEASNNLALPISLYEKSGRLNFAGILLFSTAGNKLELRGKIDHSSGGYFDEKDLWSGITYYNNDVKRAYLNNSYLLTFSNKFLKINSLDDINSVKELKLSDEGDDKILATPAASQTEAGDKTEDGAGASATINDSIPASNNQEGIITSPEAGLENQESLPVESNAGENNIEGGTAENTPADIPAAMPDEAPAP